MDQARENRKRSCGGRPGAGVDGGGAGAEGGEQDLTALESGVG